MKYKFDIPLFFSSAFFISSYVNTCVCLWWMHVFIRVQVHSPAQVCVETRERYQYDFLNCSSPFFSKDLFSL